jgi:aminopeptidase N
MKKLLFLTFILASFGIKAQTERTHPCAHSKIAAFKSQHASSENQKTTAFLPSHEKEYDVKFVHLNLNVERTTKYISGSGRTVATVTAATLDTFSCLLHLNLIIDSVRLNGVLKTYTRKDSVVKVKTSTTMTTGQTIDALIYYHGTPPVGGSAIGSGFSNGNSTTWGNQCTWSLSESLVAYHWWPCKQILTDKIDSSWVFVTTDSTNKAGSNGLLKNVVVVPGGKKRYEWKSKHFIDYYLISVAVAKYKEYDLYAKPMYLAGDSILIQNYIYDNAWASSTFQTGQKLILDKMKPVLEFECNMYGMYKFKDEKYGHCMAPFGGGMEHQTMTSLGFFDYYVDAHELGHQWWGDNVTCKGWQDIWINEGWASYTEHLVAQYLDPANFLPNLNAAHNNVMSAPGGMCFLVGHDTVDANKIFDSRLTYDKGGAIIRTLQFVINNDSLWFNGIRGFQNTFGNSTASVPDFKSYMETYTSMNFTQFFNQWYYGQGYPTFATTWNNFGTTVVIKAVQSTSTPTSVPVFITPIQYAIKRSSLPDTIVRVMHTNPTETYTFSVMGTVTTVSVDPNQWIINKATVAKDITLGVENTEALVNEISIAPNPTSGVIHVKLSNDIRGTAEVFDVSGKLVIKENLNADMKIDISNKDAGVYMVVLKDESGAPIKTEKLIKN